MFPFEDEADARWFADFRRVKSGAFDGCKLLTFRV